MATTPASGPASSALPDWLMDLVVGRVLAKPRSEWEAELDLLVSEHGDHAEALRAVVRGVAAAERLLADGFHDPGTTVRSFGDYAIEHELGRGGMGVVYAAEQRTLRRRVALKVLSVPVLLQPRALERFQRESRLLAQLDHQGIVRVIEAGSAGGTQYYTMEFVDGAPLAAVIEAVRRGGLASATGATIGAAVAGAARQAEVAATAPPAAGARSERSYVRAVAEIGAQVADALAFAHAAGVIHRDVKPTNVLLRRDGTAVLTDFGIARTEHDPALTSTGDFTGTPFYMSPEQARGARVDHRTDVFSLGATLYELLTLRRPFEGPDATAVLVRIQRDEPVDPRRHNPAVPAELAAIVLAALAKDPAQRYQGAGAMAADLRAFLAGEPVTARPPGRAQRLLRWCRREPWKATALATAAAATLALAGLTLAFTNRLLAENLSTKAALAFAEQNFTKATQAVDEMLTRVGQRDLADVPQMELVRRELLQRALAFYEDFAVAGTGDRHSQLQLAVARGRVAWIHRLLDDSQAAIRSAVAAIAGFDALLRTSPGDAAVALERAEVQLTLASAHAGLGDHEAAGSLLADVLATLEPLSVPPALELARRRRIAFARYGIAAGQRLRDPPAARATFERAVAELAAVQRDAPGDSMVLLRLANARITLGWLAINASDSKTAEALLRQAEADLAGAPAKPELMRLGALVHETRAFLYKDTGRLQEAVESAMANVKAWQGLVAAFPHTPNMKSRLGQAWSGLGNCQRYLDRIDEAVAATREAVRLYEGLTTDLPDVVEHREGLARALINLGSMLSRSDRPAWHEEGSVLLRRASDLADSLHRAQPAQAESARLAADCLNESAFVAGRAGQHEQARGMYERAAALWGEAVARHPDNTGYQDGQANMLRGVAEELLALGDPATALATADRSLGILRTSLERDARNPARRRFARDGLGVRVAACARLADHAAAAASLAELTGLADGPPDALEAAALAAGHLAGPDPGREAYATACLAALSRAVELGFKDAEALARDERFRRLRRHPGFKSLQQRITQ